MDCNRYARELSCVVLVEQYEMEVHLTRFAEKKNVAKTDSKSTDDICYLQNLCRTKHLLSLEFAVKKANECRNLTSTEVR